MRYKEYDSCELCPRNCRVDRNAEEKGFCGESSEIRVGRASLHMWEEPCLSGENGSGTVFFAGCSLGCCYCQNHSLSHGKDGIGISTARLAEIFLELQKKGAHNINLVTAEHFAPHIKDTVSIARNKGLVIPVVLNSSGYVKEETLELLRETIDIFLVDFKYMDSELAEKYSLAGDYPMVAKKALQKMTEIAGPPVFDNDGPLQKGVIVRHLCLPGCAEDSKKVLKYVFDTYGDNVIMSIMSQYTPVKTCDKFHELTRKLTEKEYESIINYCFEIGVENAYIQEGESADESFIPSFDGYGIIY